MEVLLILWILLTILALILDIENDKETNKIIEQYKQICTEYSKLTGRLMKKMIKIKLIIYSNLSEEEKNKKIEKVIQSSNQTDIDNF